MIAKQERVDAFLKHWEAALLADLEAHPERYSWRGRKVFEEIRDRTRYCLETLSPQWIGKNGVGYKQACKALKIRDSYKSVRAYLTGDAK